MEPRAAARNALEAVLEARPGESILIDTDDVQRDVAKPLHKEQSISIFGLECSFWKPTALNT